jgi:hypothetical protein
VIEIYSFSVFGLQIMFHSVNDLKRKRKEKKKKKKKKEKEKKRKNEKKNKRGHKRKMNKAPCNNNDLIHTV